MTNTKIGVILIAVSIYVMVLIPILMDPNSIKTVALWTVIYILLGIMVFGVYMIMND